jgi:long-chain fatty acid transport protein
MRTLVVSLTLCALAGVARAGGFEIGELGAAATGMVGAFAAKADDPSTIFYNPAGLADQHALQVYVGTTLIAGRPSTTTQNGDAVFAPIPTAYVSGGLTHNISVGIGAFSQFGLKVDWPADWQGRFLVTRVELDTITINPSVAWRPAHWVAIGGGIDITPASVDLKRSFDLVAAEGTARFRADDVGTGANAGVLIDVAPVTIGVSYRSHYDLSFSGGSLSVNAPPELSMMLHDTRASATVPIPDVIKAGVGVRAMSRLFLQAEVDWTNWSRFQELNLVAQGSPLMSVSVPQNWSDGYVLRTGGEWAWDTFRVRGGFGYDWNPVPTNTLGPIVPDSNRWLFSGGIESDFGNSLIGELSLMGVIFESRRSTLPTLPVEYSNFAVLTGLTLRYKH